MATSSPARPRRPKRRRYARPVHAREFARDARLNACIVYEWIRKKWCPVLKRKLRPRGFSIRPTDANDILDKLAELRRNDRAHWPSLTNLARECRASKTMLCALVKPPSKGGIECGGVPDDSRTAQRYRRAGRNETLVTLIRPKLAETISAHYAVEDVPETMIPLASVPGKFPPVSKGTARRRLKLTYYRCETRNGNVKSRPHVPIEAARTLQARMKKARASNGTRKRRVDQQPLRVKHEEKIYLYVPHAERLYEAPLRSWKSRGECPYLPDRRLPDFRRLRVPKKFRRRVGMRHVVDFVLESDVSAAVSERERRNSTARAANRGKPTNGAPMTIAQAAAHVGVSEGRATECVYAGEWEGVTITKLKEATTDKRGRAQPKRLVAFDEVSEVKRRRDERLSLNPFPPYVDVDGKRYFRPDLAADKLGLSVARLRWLRRQGKIEATETELRGHGKGWGPAKWYYFVESAQPTAADHLAPNADAPKQPPATTSGTSPTPEQPNPTDDTWWGVSQFALHFHCARGTADSRLKAFREGKPDRGGADWTENPDAGARQPAHLYRFGAVKHLFA